MRARWAAIVGVLVCTGTVSATSGGSELDANAAKFFKVRWSSVRYDKSVDVRNPDVAKSATKQSTTENLTLSLEVAIRDPNLVLGTAREGMVTEVTDKRGRRLAIPVVPSSPFHPGMYEAPRYIPTFRQPSVPKWRKLVRRLLGRPPIPSGPPQMVQELQPNTLTVRLDMGLLEQAGGTFQSVKGCFHALIAQSIEQVDVPFEPNNTWLRLTPDVEIRVKEAIATTNSYQLEIEMRPQLWNLTQQMLRGQSLPSRIVVSRDLVGEDGKSQREFHGGSPLMMPLAGHSSGSTHNLGKIKAIRFFIAVDPVDRTIPFELRNVPLPHPGP